MARRWPSPTPPSFGRRWSTRSAPLLPLSFGSMSRRSRSRGSAVARGGGTLSRSLPWPPSCERPSIAVARGQGSLRPAPGAAEGREFVVRELDRRRADVLFEMRDLAGAGDRQHDRAAFQEPGERDLAGARLVLARDRVERRAGPRRRAGVERRPGDEADVVFLAKIERRLARAVDEIVAVLDRGDREDPGGRLDLGDTHFRQARAADDLVLDQRGDGVELLARRHFRIDAMQLPQVDDLDAEAPAARMRLLDQIFRPAERNPDVRAGASEPALGRDMDLAIRSKRFPNELLGEIGAVRIGGVDEVDAEIGQAAERLQSLRAISGRTPDSVADDAHCAEAETVDVKGAANAKAAGFRGVDHGFSLSKRRAYGQLARGGIEDRIEATLPPVFNPKIVPRS